MTDSNQTLPSPSPQANTSTKKNKSLSWLSLLLIVLLATSLVGGGIFFWQNLQQHKLLINHLNNEKQQSQAQLKELKQSLNQSLKTINSEAQRQAELLGKLDRQSVFNTQTLNEMGASSRADWLLAEAEYLLHLANQRLQLESDKKSAEALLVAADKVLAEINDPGLLPVREALNQELLSIQQLSHLDRDGIYMTLNAMNQLLDDLKIGAYLQAKNDQKTASEAQKPQTITDDNLPTLQRVWREIWTDLKKVVLIRRLNDPVEPLLAPEQNYYLKQNLRLMFEQANLALLEQNEEIFSHSLEKASKWVNNYFNHEDVQTQALLKTINDLKELNIAYEKPDISNSLRLLKTKIESMYLNHTLGKLANPPVKEQHTDAQQESAQ